MIDKKDRFIIKNYGKKPPFSNFLPGVSGEKGIPLWSHYVNRGQGISCFGVEDKDHSIMEFYPAHQAYENTKRMGFRTFVKVDGKVIEGFSDENNPHTMYIGMNELKINEKNMNANLDMSVTYFTLPGEKVGALVRIVKIKNISEVTKNIEIIDGMPVIIPYGVDLESKKLMGQTSKAWMEVQDHKENTPFFHVRASMNDTAVVHEIIGGNFGFAYSDKGEELPVIINTENIFDYDTSLEHPVAFEYKTIDQLMVEEQITKNELPCCFFGTKTTLAAGQTYEIYEVYGQTESKEILKELHKKASKKEYFTEKIKEAIHLTKDITSKMDTKTGNHIFDLYCRQTYLDNALRGGYPVLLGEDKLFYLYSRKHGDMERDYNFFKMLPEYYSQGNGNYRDVNQNRRNDVLFAPYVEDFNIKLFYNAIQLNGYNPLGIEKITYTMKEDSVSKFLEIVEVDVKNEMSEFLENAYTPGKLYEKIESCKLSRDISTDEAFELAMNLSDSESKTDFLEGYWCDHWTYNLDLIENYLCLYPDKEEELLFEDSTYTYLVGGARILPHKKRYQVAPQGIRQYRFIEKEAPKHTYIIDENGNTVYGTLIEKLLVLDIVKFTALDPYGLGLEMEGGKPGWYDALNGLPGLLGSSMAETYELIRNIEYTLGALKRFSRPIHILQEVSELANEIQIIIEKHKKTIFTATSKISFWNDLNAAKEHYFEKTYSQVSGKLVTYSYQQITTLLESLLEILQYGANLAMELGDGISPTYFYYEVTKYQEKEDGIYIEEVELHKNPSFLEGPVRYLKLNLPKEQKKELYHKVKNSDLYDNKLSMYKVNASLADSTFELGRTKAFTPGWLENESIWLHMEYKYLLELLKNEFYEEYIEDSYKALVPFLDADVYGRSLLENSSFIASSANPNPKIYGKGFVARLSGSTAEFLNMWQIMMFGDRPFSMNDNQLCLKFNPTIPSYIIGNEKRIEVNFLGNIPLIYHLADNQDYIPGNYKVVKIEITSSEDNFLLAENIILGELATTIRNQEVSRIEIYLER